MIGFLLKIVIVAALVVGVVFFISSKKPGSLSSLSGKVAGSSTVISSLKPSSLLSGVKNINLKNINLPGFGTQISSALDSLVTHADKNSPVVLGVKITNDSLITISDTLRGLPPDQFSQIRSLICSPATPSAQ